ncbi:hypothetical protein [Sessilibacter corallicola]|uniref:hypothetical protein n=1 Tax=Sessilibacter corallicola TaxID=2904075 RepID=UPI001E52FEB7|nr:hypothetical protein [Sessilibacter corallicola]MCE2028734.1 hypothetical protein [Sessilibacter corallicola]
MSDDCSNSKKELSETEGIERLNKKIKELKKRNITPPIDEDEPTGLLSGGPEHLDLDNEK